MPENMIYSYIMLIYNFNYNYNYNFMSMCTNGIPCVATDGKRHNRRLAVADEVALDESMRRRHPCEQRTQEKREREREKQTKRV
jgi:hypothetical protein